MSSNIFRISIIFALSALLAVSASSTAEACSQEAATGLGTPLVLPTNGQNAPPNTKVWVSAPIEDYYEYTDTTPLVASDMVLRSAGDDIDVSTRTVSVAGDYLTHLWVIEPAELLSEGQTVQVWIRGEQVSSFVVSGNELLSPPAAPTLVSLDASGEYFGLLFCGERSQVRVSVRDESALLFLTEPGDHKAMPMSALAVGTGHQATALDFPPGKLELQVIAIDLAGNQSLPTLLPSVTIPSTVTGCSVGSRQAPPTWLLLLAFVLLRFRRIRSD